jgi:hypothetical protein
MRGLIGLSIGKFGSLVAAGRLVACGVVSLALAAGAVRGAGIAADDPLAIRDAVGAGIHAYYSGDFARSYDDLTSAVEAGANDARAYYFRGLSSLRLGRSMEAESDFRMGAEREAADGSMLRVSRSLERVQGHDRLVLEKHRARARLASLAREREAVGRRYSQIEDATSDVLRRRRPEDIRPELVDPRLRRGAAAAEEVPSPKPAAGKTKSPFGDEEEDPFAGDAKPKSGDEPEEMEAEKEEMDADKEEMDAEKEEMEADGAAADGDAAVEETASALEDAAADRDAQAEVDAAAGN